MSDQPKKIIAAISGRDQIEIDLQNQSVSFEGCTLFSDLILDYKKKHSLSPHQWPYPQGTGHHHLLLKEFLMKLHGKWRLPYEHEELCHCRLVSTQTVLEAIAVGAHHPQMVSRWTTASSACGTCRPEVEKLIRFRLADPNDPQ